MEVVVEELIVLHLQFADGDLELLLKVLGCKRAALTEAAVGCLVAPVLPDELRHLLVLFTLVGGDSFNLVPEGCLAVVQLVPQLLDQLVPLL